jgi:hypothetical protein
VGVKYVFSAWVLETLFFNTWVSIRITDSISVLEKDQISTSVKFSIQKLTVCHLAPLRTQYMSLPTCQDPHNCQIPPKSVNDVGVWCESVWVIWQLCGCWHVERDRYLVLSSAKWHWRGGPLVFRWKIGLKY